MKQRTTHDCEHAVEKCQGTHEERHDAPDDSHAKDDERDDVED